MPRLYLFAEGQTELTFADRVLKPHLAGLGVYLHPPILIAHAKKKGRVHRGGGRRYAPMRNDILRFLAQERGRDVFFTTMIDLYALAADVPGTEATESLRHLPFQRVEALERAFAGDIGDERFLPYIQLHEFEACLFADPSWFSFFYDRCEAEIASLRAVADAHDSPELIDDGPHSAPSKRIARVFPDYEDVKAVVGPQVAELIGLALIRSRCPHFAGWLTRLESLSPRLR